MLTAKSLDGRIRRLRELAEGLAREVGIWKRGGVLLTFPERKDYLSAIYDALAGADAARVVLVEAQRRIEEQARRLAAQNAGHRAALDVTGSQEDEPPVIPAKLILSLPPLPQHDEWLRRTSQ